MNINPFEYIDVPLWCVYGPDSFPTIFACKIIINNGTHAIWGYSVYRRSPGYRTLGQYLKNWITSVDNPKFFQYQFEALEYLSKLVTPKCQ